MHRILLFLVVFVVVPPVLSYGQDWTASYDGPLPESRSATSASNGNPLPQIEFAFNDAIFLGDNVERFDWLNLERPEGSVELGDLIVRGQGDADTSSSDGGGSLSNRSNDPTSSLIQFYMQNFFTTESFEGSGHGYFLQLQPVIPIDKFVRVRPHD